MRAATRFAAPAAVLLALLAAVPAGADAAGGRVRPTTDFARAEPGEEDPGGAATAHHAPTARAFAQPPANLPFGRLLDFKVGDAVFRKLWVSAPSSTRSSDGLGPLWNARSCQSCHVRDGRGRPPPAGETATSLLLRLSIPPQTDADRRALADGDLAVVPDPTYGVQLQPFAVQGHRGEGSAAIAWTPVQVRLADGTVIALRRPTYTVRDLGYGPLHPQAMLSPRVAPPMIGLGLVEMIAEADILAGADPEDGDGDGIAGRPNRLARGPGGVPALGRFGWKAGQPTLAQQAAEAFALDMGLSATSGRAPWGDCTPRQPECRGAPHGGTGEDAVEVAPALLDLVVFYVRHLAVPARRDVADPRVLHGKRLFYASGCIGCHTPKFVTAADPARPELSGLLVWPYSDFLLHDMGEGLADGRPEGRAGGRDWRTPPLWGIGLTEVVSGHTFLLHDGRARGLLEAILWHGGEAEAAKRRVAAMRRADREALLTFLRSL
ncbi:MAG: thiol oxidoreductase [Alphaproteobacteria bacterium]|nr:thiol oxidoreductase [Alphaproteobacteria bacterium]